MGDVDLVLTRILSCILSYCYGYYTLNRSKDKTVIIKFMFHYKLYGPIVILEEEEDQASSRKDSWST